MEPIPSLSLVCRRLLVESLAMRWTMLLGARADHLDWPRTRFCPLRLRGSATLLATAIVLAGLACETVPVRPNVVVIMTDDHATQMMSAYGSERASTPNLDRIAEEGMIFRNSFCTNPLCAPSRATLITGKYSHSNGQRGNRDIFDGSQPTLPKMLQHAGYRTAIVGKWHLRSEPSGFDYWNVLPGQGRYRNPTLIEMGEEHRHSGYVSTIITDLAVEWIRDRDRTRPFLLFLHHKAPHGQWVPDENHEGLFEDERVPRPESFDDDYAGRAAPIRNATNRLVPDLLARWRTWGAELAKEDPGDLAGEELAEWMYQQYVKDYKRVMVSVDENVGRFLDFLEDEGLADDTLVIYTSDNGKFVGDHFMFDKRLMHEESLRIPLAVRYPRAIAAGSETGAFALNVDFAPTILDYAGVAVPEDVQGRSLRPVLEGRQPADWRDSFYFQYFEPPGGHNVIPHYGVRTERYKLVRHEAGDGVWEFVDLESDPLEYRNEYENPRYSAQVLELREELQLLRESLEAADE